jgi:muramoyltetrapeptide carboxypeptidase
MVKPPRLKRGDLVGLIAPGGVVDPAGVERRVRNLESLGFRVRTSPNLLAARGGFAGTVPQRLSDLHAMFRDREVAGIWAARGGSGCNALLPSIDYDLIRAHPKVLVGFSDITALHVALYRHAGLVSFHGPTAGSTFADFSVEHLRAVVMEPKAGHVLPAAPQHAERAASAPQFARRTYRGGVAEGRLVGGNLSIVSALAGTPYAPETRGHLLFLEEVREAPYRIDRMLTQLHQAGISSRVAGMILGVFEKCEPPDDDPSLTLAETLQDHLGASEVPAAYWLFVRARGAPVHAARRGARAVRRRRGNDHAARVGGDLTSSGPLPTSAGAAP